ncbi:MAG: DUF5110 domain-containing protein [Clostridiaceae bacterium]|nr:DUF5110 domain-containing protein [Clostridiaceae bacterium]
MLVFFLLISSVAPINTIPVFGYVSALGNITYSSVSGDNLTLTIDNGTESGDDILELKLCEDNILKVDYRPNGVSTSSDTPIIDPNKTWSSVGANIDTSGNPILITTDSMRIEIATTPCRMTVKKADGTTLLWEPSAGGVYYDGVRFMNNTSDNIYGIRSYEFTDSAGELLRNNNSHAAHAGQQGDSGGPIMWSTSGYGILVDSDGGYPYTESATGKFEFYVGGTPTEGRRYTKSDLEYYIMLGNPKEIMNSVSEITGKAPMLPKWSLGFSNFEWDTTQTEVTNMVDTYRAKNIPIDSYGLDYDWKNYGLTNYGEFTWNTTKYPDSSSTTLKNTMDSKGIKMIGITKPRIVTLDANNNRTTQYADAENGGYWYPGHSEYTDYFIPVQVRSIDFYNQSCRTWFWNHSQDAFDKGIVGWWNDETDKVSSGSAQYWFGNFSTTHISQALYEGQRNYTSGNTRVWQTARTFYPGAQRYATTLWSGDIGIQFYKGEKVSWAAGMQEQRAVMLSSVNNGQAKWGMDIGGFNQADGTTANPTPELYTRWVQFGAFTPMFRVHGNNHQQRQPWYYGTTAEEVAKSTIQLRYSLIPYMYSSERTAYESGLGLVRPLIYDYPSDSNVSNYTDAWMFGDSMLVAPVVDAAQTLKSIYLPAGTWIDYFRGTAYTGGQTIKYPVNAQSLTDIPVFVKKGGIIPTQKVLDYVGQNSITSVNVDVFADTSQSSFTYYDDDGTSYNYEGTSYFKQEMTAQDNGGSGISFSVGAKNGTYSPSLQYYIAQIHGKAGTGVTINSSAVNNYADLNALKAATGEGWTIGKDVYGPVTYVKVSAGSSSAKNVVVTGTATVSDTSTKYEAEEGSLSGNTTSTKASVNTNHTGYSGSGFVDGLGNDDAAVTLYSNVKTAGDYNVGIRYANASGSAKTMSIFVNGSRVKQTSLATLTDWNTWSTKNETIPLSAGNNIITLKYYDDAGDTGNVNVDYVTVPFEASTQKYEGESAELSGGAATNTNHYFYSGAAFVDGMTSVGAQTKFNVNIPSSGSYKVKLKYANGNGSTKTLSTYVNGTDVATASLTSPSTNWNTWQDNEQTLTLNAGLNTIAYKYDSGDSGNVNLDRILVAATTPPTPQSELSLLDNGGFERSTTAGSNWTEWHPTGQTLAYGIDSGSGSNPPTSAWTGSNRAYFWLGTTYQQSIHQVITVPTNNANYKFEAWVKLDYTTPTTARAEISNYGGNAVYYNISKDGVWKYISINNIYVTNGQIDVGFYVNSPGGTTLHIDDVRITAQ